MRNLGVVLDARALAPVEPRELRPEEDRIVGMERVHFPGGARLDCCGVFLLAPRVPATPDVCEIPAPLSPLVDLRVADVCYKPVPVQLPCADNILDRPMWWARALFRPRIDRCVPHTQQVKMGTVCRQPRRKAGANLIFMRTGIASSLQMVHTGVILIVMWNPSGELTTIHARNRAAPPP